MDTNILDIPKLQEETKATLELVKGDADYAKKQEAVYQTVTKLADLSTVLSDILIDWDHALSEANLVVNKVPPTLLDYLDELIIKNKITSPQEIIFLFEKGELKDIVTEENEIDHDALAKLGRSMKRAGKKQKKVVEEEDEFDIF
jgi:hypothetical protein